MEPYDILKESACTSSLAAPTKQECLLELSRLIAAPGGGFELGELLEALERREEQGSTAFGDGPSGFSLDASLIEPSMPNSRSSSSMGLPGW